VRNRLPARIFTVDFLAGERRIPAVGFPNSAAGFSFGNMLSMNETREEKL